MSVSTVLPVVVLSVTAALAPAAAHAAARRVDGAHNAAGNVLARL